MITPGRTREKVDVEPSYLNAAILEASDTKLYGVGGML